jgi:sugar phosphate isomerase/epimerase
MSELAIFTDDISQDLEHSLDVAAEYNLNWVEIRSAWGKNLVFQSDEDIQKVVNTIHNRGFRVPSVSAPVFKSHLPGHDGGKAGNMFHGESADSLEQQITIIRRSAQIARLFGTNRIRCFSFWQIGDNPIPLWDDMLFMFNKAVKIAEEENIILVMENDFECNLGSGELAAKMMAEVDSPHLRILWDCGNSKFVGESPYPEGYEFAKPWIGHVHVKDAVIDPGTKKPRWVALGTGEIDMLGQLQALKDDGYNDVISLENHYTPAGGSPEDGVRESLENLLKLLTKVK